MGGSRRRRRVPPIYANRCARDGRRRVSLQQRHPPYTIADSYNKIHGINSVGLKRAGLNAIQRLEIKRAFSAIYRNNQPFRIAAVEALTAAAWGPEAREFFEFIVSSKRGICGRSAPKGDTAETE
jgi:UDP-N-acetylglucosamine acyltransferase